MGKTMDLISKRHNELMQIKTSLMQKRDSTGNKNVYKYYCQKIKDVEILINTHEEILGFRKKNRILQ